MTRRAVLVDLGSTFTKAALVDLEHGELIATSSAPTTVTTDVAVGLEAALAGLPDTGGARILASSSAAGGLRMVSIGLVPDMSAEAARQAALGAGAKLVGGFAHELAPTELEQISALAPDIVLLAGGTDGGNSKVILHNARMLAGSDIAAPIVVAGNKAAQSRVQSVLADAGKRFRLVGNVMPEVGVLDVEPCREAIRAVFLETIVQAKGLDDAAALAGHVVMPTPAAVLRGARLLAEGVAGTGGLGDLVVIDVGGATTDVYSIAAGLPSRGASLRGLPEPYAKRTVEGDLGVRHNVDTLLEVAHRHGVDIDAEAVGPFRRQADAVPVDDRGRRADTRLATVAVAESFSRHVGRIEIVYGPHGQIVFQTGKDLTNVRHVLGTGGPLVRGSDPVAALCSVLKQGQDDRLLRPTAARFLVDREYVLFAAGLLAQEHPGAALAMLRRGLVEAG